MVLRSSRVLSVLAALASLGTAHASDAAYFRVSGTEPSDEFVIMLTDEAKIAEARAIVDGTETVRVHVHGIILPVAEKYNAPWSFHLDPDTIQFFEMAAEVCDAKTSYVQDHLSDVGGAFLPGGHWCPWASRVISEIPPPQE